MLKATTTTNPSQSNLANQAIAPEFGPPLCQPRTERRHKAKNGGGGTAANGGGLDYSRIRLRQPTS